MHDNPDQPLTLGPSIDAGDLIGAPEVLIFRNHPSEYELLWIIEGQINFFRETNVGPQAIVLWRPRKPPGFWTGNKPMRGISLRFTIETYPQSWGPPRLWPRWRKLHDGDICRPLLSFLNTHLAPVEKTPTEKTHAEKTPADKTVSRPALAALLAAFVTGRVTCNTPSMPVFSPIVASALNVMKKRLALDPSDRLTPQTIADEIGVSRPTLASRFRREVGRPPIAELYLARLDRAVALLARTNLPSNVLAQMTGFTHDAHLTQYCRANFGLTSAKLRQALQKGKIPYPAPRSPHLDSGVLFPDCGVKNVQEHARPTMSDGPSSESPLPQKLPASQNSSCEM